jgi:hypothetical protein
MVLSCRNQEERRGCCFAGQFHLRAFTPDKDLLRVQKHQPDLLRGGTHPAGAGHHFRNKRFCKAISSTI